MTRTHRNTLTIRLIAIVAIQLAAGFAEAGVADTPLPRFADGKPGIAVFRRTGVISRGRLQTDFMCTSHDTVPVDIGIEVFSSDGTLLNNVGAGNGARLNVLPGETVTIGTSGTAGFLESLTMSIAQVAQGSARAVASSAEVECTAVVVDDRSAPPVTIGELAPGTTAAAGAVIEGVALPRFADGTVATHALVFPGVVKRGRMETNVFCTALATRRINVGVEIFDAHGSAMNDVQAGNGAVLAVAPGATVTFSTTGTAGFLDTVIIETAGVAQGLARVVSDSAEVLCSAGIVDSDLSPPVAMSTLLGSSGLDESPPSATPTSPVATPTPTSAPVMTPTPASLCAGDCDGDGGVTVDELVRGISIALGSLPADACTRFDTDAGGTVTVDEIISAVVMALNSCDGAPIATQMEP